MSNENRRHLLSTVLAVLQPLALSWVTVVILSVFTYVLAASSPMLEQTQWHDAAQLGTSVWLLALGAPIEVGGASIGMMPLLLTVCLMLVCNRFLRRVPVLDWVDVGVSALVGALTVGIISFFSLPGSFRLMGVLGGAIVVGACALYSWWRREPPAAAWWGRIRGGWPLLWPLLVGFMVASAICLGIAVFAGWSQITAINGYYVLGAAGTIFLTIAQLLFLPNLLVWAVAHISGTGFAVGSGTSFSSLGVVSAPLPALPILGALPSPGTGLPWLIAIPSFIGLTVGLWRATKLRTLAQLAGYGTGVSAAFLIVAALLGAVSSGGIGPGRMAVMGVEPPLFAAVLTLETCGAMLLGLVLRNPQLHEKLRGARAARRSKNAESTSPEGAAPGGTSADGMPADGMPADGEHAGSVPEGSGADPSGNPGGAASSVSSGTSAVSPSSARLPLTARSARSALSSRSARSTRSALSARSAMSARSARSATSPDNAHEKRTGPTQDEPPTK